MSDDIPEWARRKADELDRLWTSDLDWIDSMARALVEIDKGAREEERERAASIVERRITNPREAFITSAAIRKGDTE